MIIKIRRANTNSATPKPQLSLLSKLKADLQFVTRSPFQARTWWMYLFGINTLILIIIPFCGVPFAWWVIAFAVLFGIMELIGNVHSKGGKYPPLTDLIRTYVPNTIALAIMWGLGAAAASVWGISWNRPLFIALFFTALGWLTNHFINRYNKPASD